jgi:hypothetical protein
MYESSIEEEDKQDIQTVLNDELCNTMSRYCKDFIPSGINLNEIVSYEDAITIIIRKKYCKSKKEQRITIETDDDKPIKMLDILMHLIQHHKHSDYAKYWEGITRYSDKPGDYNELPEGEYLIQWGS